MTPEQIAQVCHEANRAYCVTIGDMSQIAWDNAPAWQQESAVDGVRFHLANPRAGPAASHYNWSRDKFATGWKHGPVKDATQKTHPQLVPYEDLPVEQRRKDLLFAAVVRALATIP